MDNKRLMQCAFMSVSLLVGCEGQEQADAEKNSERVVNISSKSIVKQDNATVQQEQDINVESELDAVMEAVIEDGEGSGILFLMDALKSPAAEVRYEAVVSLSGYIENEAVLSELLLLFDDKNKQVVLEVIDALSELNDSRVINGLHRLVDSHEKREVREAAQDAIEVLEDI